MANIALQGGKVILKGGKASCSCCLYTFYIDKINIFDDNSWVLSINNNYIGYFDGSGPQYQSFNIPINYLNLGGNNEIEFSLVVCQSDDLFTFYITSSNGDIVYSGDSGYLNGSYWESGTCTDNYFTRNFNL